MLNLGCGGEASQRGLKLQDSTFFLLPQSFPQQEGDQRLSIPDGAVAGPGQGVLPGDDVRFHVFIHFKLLDSRREILSQKEMRYLAQNSGRGKELGQSAPAPGPITGFLGKLPDSSPLGRFPQFQGARRDFPERCADNRALVMNQADVLDVYHGEDRDGTGMQHDVAHDGFAASQHGRVDRDLDFPALVYYGPRHAFLRQISRANAKTAPGYALRPRVVIACLFMG